MGSSFTEYRGKGFWTRDWGIEVWLFLLVREVDQLDSVPEWLAEAREHWWIHAPQGLMGCVHANLDEILTDEERVETVLLLARGALTWLEQHGAQIRFQELDDLMGGWPESETIETEKFLRIGRAFVALLRGELDDDSRTSKNMY